MAGGGGEGSSLEFTPTWIVAVVCALMVSISLFAERLLHRLGKVFKKKDQKTLYEALLKIKEELMLLGFISLMLVVFQGVIQKTCVSPGLYNGMTPCGREDKAAHAVNHFGSTLFPGVGGSRRRLLAGGGGSEECAAKGKVPLMSLEAIHQLHLFIFALAITHVVFTVTTMLLGSLRIQEWKHWEESIQNGEVQNSTGIVSLVHDQEFIKNHFRGIGKDSSVVRWLLSFAKQFYGSITKSDYTTMRLGFVMAHCPGHAKFNFYDYMVRALQVDFKKVVGIRWYLWIYVVVFLLLNINGWNIFFWLSFLPLVLLLAVGTKLEHVITDLAHDVAEKHTAIEGDLVIMLSDSHFWFHRPRILLYVIHFILFQNAFDIAFFFWVLATYGLHSCIMGSAGYIAPRLIIGVAVQLLCSYSTLPLYAIVTQMGSSFKEGIFKEGMHEKVVGWAQNIKKKKGSGPKNAQIKEDPKEVTLQNMGEQTEICVVEESPRVPEPPNGSRS